MVSYRYSYFVQKWVGVYVTYMANVHAKPNTVSSFEKQLEV